VLVEMIQAPKNRPQRLFDSKHWYAMAINPSPKLLKLVTLLLANQCIVFNHLITEYFVEEDIPEGINNALSELTSVCTLATNLRQMSIRYTPCRPLDPGDMHEAIKNSIRRLQEVMYGSFKGVENGGIWLRVWGHEYWTEEIFQRELQQLQIIKDTAFKDADDVRLEVDRPETSMTTQKRWLTLELTWVDQILKARAGLPVNTAIVP
jgi:hypothetical protein